MAIPGPLPKATASRERDLRRRNAPRIRVTGDDVLRGPELPTCLEWHEQTRKWWDTWRRSPLSQSWLATDWDFLLDTALMHSAMWTYGHWTMAAELRQRVGKLGATVEDRIKLKISVETPAADAKPSTALMSDYRKAAG